MNEKEITEAYQCSECKNYFSKDKLVKVLKQQNIIQMIKGVKAYKIVCNDCINKKKESF